MSVFQRGRYGTIFNSSHIVLVTPVDKDAVQKSLDYDAKVCKEADDATAEAFEKDPDNAKVIRPDRDKTEHDFQLWFYGVPTPIVRNMTIEALDELCILLNEIHPMTELIAAVDAVATATGGVSSAIRDRD